MAPMLAAHLVRFSSYVIRIPMQLSMPRQLPVPQKFTTQQPCKLGQHVPCRVAAAYLEATASCRTCLKHKVGSHRWQLVRMSISSDVTGLSWVTESASTGGAAVSISDSADCVVVADCPAVDAPVPTQSTCCPSASTSPRAMSPFEAPRQQA